MSVQSELQILIVINAVLDSHQLWSHFHCSRNETRSSKNSRFTRPPYPENHKQLQPISGLINYLQSFLPNLPSKTTFLREQILHWDWNPSRDPACHKLKRTICHTLFKTTLTYFDCTKPVVIQTDASENGLEAALL